MPIQIASLFLSCVFTSTAFAQSGTPWPKEQWPRKSLKEVGFAPKEFDKFLSAAFAKHLTFKTDAILVVKDGHLAYEGYTNGYKPEQRHALFSLGKTMMNALLGIMENKGLLHRNDDISRYYPAINQFGHKNLTVRQLLHMSSGLEWIEEDRENLVESDPWFAFYSRESLKDMPAWVARKAVLYKGERKFNYSSGDSGLLVATMRGAIGEAAYAHFAWQELFQPLGMTSMAIERDGAGNQALHGVGFASPRDIARMGLLYLTDGVVNGKRLWPRDWLAFTRQMAPAQNNAPDPGDRNLQNNQAYGAHIWLNIPRPHDSGERPYPELPANALLGLGTRGQVLLILPTEKLILVRTGTDTELSVDKRKNYRHKIFRLLYSSLTKGGQL
ncbi:MAG: serine hydrolase [Bdellovibrionales bacterium]|nr:serine hydrolase [Bdellovibrionales bacterium]